MKKSLFVVFLISSITLSSHAGSELSYSGPLSAVSAQLNPFLLVSVWQQGKGLWSDYVFSDYSYLTASLQCFPSSHHIEQYENTNEPRHYAFSQGFMGTLKAGESFAVAVEICGSQGSLAFPQFDLFYSAKGSIKLVGQVVDPDGIVSQMAHTLKESPNKGLSGGAVQGYGKAGRWIFIVKNKSRSNVDVMGAGIKVRLLD